jgi:hypothetical protein
VTSDTCEHNDNLYHLVGVKKERVGVCDRQRDHHAYKATGDRKSSSILLIRIAYMCLCMCMCMYVCMVCNVR